jgi:glycine dehydrogenase subunit 1
MRSVAELCVRKAHYAMERLTSGGTLRPAFDRPVFKEFAIRAADGRVEPRLQGALGEGILAGVPLARWYPDLADCFLVAVTEKRTKAQIDRLAAAVGNL